MKSNICRQLHATAAASATLGCSASAKFERIDTRGALENLVCRYKQLQRPLGVNFRRILPALNSADRFTHLIHPTGYKSPVENRLLTRVDSSKTFITFGVVISFVLLSSHYRLHLGFLEQGAGQVLVLLRFCSPALYQSPGIFVMYHHPSTTLPTRVQVDPIVR